MKKAFIYSSELEHLFKGKRSINVKTRLFNESVSTDYPETIWSNKPSGIIEEASLPVFTGENQSEESYLNLLKPLINRIKSSEATKVVLSRTHFVSFDQLGCSIPELLQLWKNRFSNSFIYAMHFDDKHAWLGATPERLLKFQGGLGKIDALAGTIPYFEGISPYSFSQKEIDEHAHVVEYISRVLQKMEIDYSWSSLRVKRYGSIAHLFQEVSISIKESLQIDQIERALHPTSAVVGDPLNVALQLINDMEPHERELYTGLIKVSDGKDSISFVNLRCARVFSNGLLFFIGGGITADSNPQAEWEETKNKLDSLLP